jgi:hypothetical protein
MEIKLCQKAFSSLSDAEFNRTFNQIEKFKACKIIKFFSNLFAKKLYYQFKMKISFDNFLNHLVK